MNRPGFLSLLLTLALGAWCAPSLAGQPLKMTLAHEDKASYPWVFPVTNNASYEGLDLIFIDFLQDELGIELTTVAMPWARCLVTMEEGYVDGCFSSSFKEDRLVNGVYPTTDTGEPDASKRIHSSDYSLYFIKGKDITFDGKTIYGLNGNVGVQRTFSIIPALEKLGVSVDEGTSDPVIIFRKLLLGRIAAAAIQTGNADAIIENNPEFKEHIVKYETNLAPFNKKPYFIMLSHQFVESNPEYAVVFWNAVQKVRESEAYKKAAYEFLNK